eukprot:scaffold18774_cov36-Prasinocladus_malaysianus.AAC.1
MNGATCLDDSWDEDCVGPAGVNLILLTLGPRELLLHTATTNACEAELPHTCLATHCNSECVPRTCVPALKALMSITTVSPLVIPRPWTILREPLSLRPCRMSCSICKPAHNSSKVYLSRGQSRAILCQDAKNVGGGDEYLLGLGLWAGAGWH